MRRLLSFFFRHNWDTAEPEITGLGVTHRLTCKSCGTKSEKFIILDRQHFHEIWNRRGCVGKAREEAR